MLVGAVAHDRGLSKLEWKNRQMAASRVFSCKHRQARILYVVSRLSSKLSEAASRTFPDQVQLIGREQAALRCAHFKRVRSVYSLARH